MTHFEQEKAAKKFVELWKDKGYEKGEAQKFWIQLLRDVYGIEDSEQYIDFELPIKLQRTSFADGYIEATHTLIEMKGRNVDLRKPEKQSDGSELTPYQQAKRYSDNLGYTKRARWIIVSNFKEIDIYDMDKLHSEPSRIELENLHKDFYMLNILVDNEDENIKREFDLSIDAGIIVGKIYKALSKEYLKKESDESKFAKSINALCVRLVFCLYAEDSGLFEKHMMFHNYLKKYPASELRTALIKLFKILDTPTEQRDPFENEELLEFPYINGGLFADENILIPQITEEIKEALLVDASENFNWSDISPTIFGGVFESTLNPDTRRTGGMHYTSIKNIHKVIDPLFLDELTYELDKILEITSLKEKNKKLINYQNKLASLKFFDPACGSGNFLTETYLSLRKLENRMLEAYYQGQSQLGTIEDNPIKVNINQFFGIEINDFAVTVAKTALWIAEAQMYQKTKHIVLINDDFLPLKSYTQITEANSLRIDWNEVISKYDLNYIIGNPPFVGQQLRTESQSQDMNYIFTDNDQAGHLDYVTCWYKKACDYILNTKIKVAFVSTNSICQGEQVPILWGYLFKKYNIDINFAHRSFIWDSEANQKASVHCVIIGFSLDKNKDAYLYDTGITKKVSQINGYLIDAPKIILDARKNIPQKGLPKLIKGSQPTDDGNLLLTKEEALDILKKDNSVKECIRPFVGAREFLNSTEQDKFCIWLKDISPNVYSKNRDIMSRIEKVREFRLKSKNSQTRDCADTPNLFTQIRQPNSDYIVIPRVSSQNRKYIPMAYMSKNVIAGDTTTVLPDANLYIFGILESNVHMSWMRTVCGRLKSDYRYSPAVYNNFPFPNVTDAQKEKIIKTASNILNVRKKYANVSLAELYGEKMNLIYNDLFLAHKENDKAVMEAYGFNWKKMSESDCVAELMKMYQNLINE